MKQQFLAWMNRIDALTLRERAIVFVGTAGAIIFLMYTFVLNPLFAKQALLRRQLIQHQNASADIDADIAQKTLAASADPDQAMRDQLNAAKAEVAKLAAAFQTQQKGLVAPEKIALLLETILKGNGRLQLVSMKTLPVSAVGDPAAKKDTPDLAAQKTLKPNPASAANPAATPVKVVDLLFRHGVEIELQGNYLDMVNYMTALEAMPSQLFWAKARLNAADYPKVRLNLTLYTLSLDQRWIKL